MVVSCGYRPETRMNEWACYPGKLHRRQRDTFMCPAFSTRRWMSATRSSPQASTFSTAGVRSASAMYGATSFFFTAAVRLRALCSSSQLGEFLFQLLRLLLQAIGHVDQSLNPCQHLKFFWRQSFSRDVRQREFLASGHDLGSVDGDGES